MESNEIKRQAKSAVIWNTAEKLTLKAGSFVIGIVLARLLLPSDYGLVGMLDVFIALSSVFIQSGFAQALICKKDCTERDFSTIFFCNLIMASLIAVILYFVSPWVASFYNEPLLCPLLRVLSLNLVLGSFNIVQQTILTKAVDFKSLAQINVLSLLVSGTIGIAMAYMGFGVWALVGQTLSSTISKWIIFPFYSHWKPMRTFSVKSFKELFAYGSKLLMTQVVATIVNNVSMISIGKVYQSSQLGFYSRAMQMTDAFSSIVYGILGSVSFPLLAKLQDDKEKFIQLYRKSLFYAAIIMFPITAALVGLAKPIVVVLLTEKWLPCVFLIQVLAIVKMFTPFSAIQMNVLNAMGRPDLFMKVDFSKIPMDLTVLAITVPMGIEAVVIGYLFTGFVSFLINCYYPSRMLGYGALNIAYDCRYVLLSAFFMLVVELLLGLVIQNQFVLLLLGASLGFGTYVASCLAFKVISIAEIKSLIKKNNNE
jgi:O-antigen/teichoic acid export membrane protein